MRAAKSLRRSVKIPPNTRSRPSVGPIPLVMSNPPKSVTRLTQGPIPLKGNEPRVRMVVRHRSNAGIP